jgi:integrase
MGLQKMASSTTGKFLQRRGQSWYVRVRVPVSLQEKVGNTHLRRALGTQDKREAERRKWRVVAELKAHLEHVRKHGVPPPTRAMKPHGPHGNPRAYAEQIRTLRKEGSSDAADAVEMMAWEAADEIEAKSGEQAKRRWLGAAFTDGRTLDEWFTDWIDQAPYKEGTKATYKLALAELRALLGLAEGDSLLADDITDTTVARYAFEFLPAKGYSVKSMATRIGALSSFWTFLQQRLAVAPGRNPWTGLKLSRVAPRTIAAKTPDKRPFTDAELVTLLHGTDKSRKWDVYPRVRDLLLLGLYTGARLNDLCSLRAEDLTVADGAASATLVVREGKTNAAARTIAVTHWAVLAMLQRRLAGKKPGAQLFEELRPGGADKKLSDSVSKAFTRYRRACGVPDGTDYHSLRRSFLTLHEHRGTDYVAVARFVGHEVPTMMHAVYSAGASREALLKVADATRYSPEIEKAVAGLI